MSRHNELEDGIVAEEVDGAKYWRGGWWLGVGG